MKINDLTKSQFLLLVLLIILVTSTTTAIVTVTLLDQSPQAGIDRTINQVVERAIGKIAPGATTTIVRIVERVPGLPTEGQLIVEAVNKVSPSLVKIEQKTATGEERLGTGFVTRGNLIVTGAKNIPADVQLVNIALGKANLQADLISRNDNYGVAIFRVNAVGTEFSQPIAFSQEGAVVGQTSIGLSLSDTDSPEVSTGIILNIVGANAEASSTAATSTTDLIRTTAVNSDNIGGPVINAKGEIIGLGIARGYAIAAKTLKTLIDQIK